MWFVLHPSCKILNRYATEKQEKKILKNKNDEDKVAETTTEGESEEATEQPNKSKENRKRNATINERDTHTQRQRDGGRRRMRRRERNLRCKEKQNLPNRACRISLYIPPRDRLPGGPSRKDGCPKTNIFPRKLPKYR